MSFSRQEFCKLFGYSAGNDYEGCMIIAVDYVELWIKLDDGRKVDLKEHYEKVAKMKALL